MTRSEDANEASSFSWNVTGGSSQLPDSAQETAGFQLFKVQQGKEPDDWKPMATIGPGVQEIRVREARRAFRVFYVAKFEEAIYVLHVRQKRSQKTAQADLYIGRSRFADVLKWRREEGL